MMARGYIGICLLVVVIFNAVDNSASQNIVKDCNKLVLDVAKKQVKQIAACTKEFRAKGMTMEQIHGKFNCLVKCALEKEELIDDDHKVTKATLQRFLDKFVPEDYHEVAHDVMEGCISEFSPLMNADDPYCQAQGEFFKCAKNFVSELCH